MSNSSSKLWSLVESVVKAAGLELFDIEMPRGSGGILRIFIHKNRGAEVVAAIDTTLRYGVDVSDCARINKTLINMPEIEEFMPGDTLLEVSSPGVNRKLTRKEHFAGAIGERIKVIIHKIEGDDRGVVRGILKTFDGSEISLEEENSNESLVIPFERVREARVDFQFR